MVCLISKRVCLHVYKNSCGLRVLATQTSVYINTQNAECICFDAGHWRKIVRHSFEWYSIILIAIDVQPQWNRFERGAHWEMLGHCFFYCFRSHLNYIHFNESENELQSTGSFDRKCIIKGRSPHEWCDVIIHISLFFVIKKYFASVDCPITYISGNVNNIICLIFAFLRNKIARLWLRL